MSSLAESNQTDGVTSDQPMLSAQRSSETYSHKIKAFSRRRKFAWAAFFGVVVCILLVLVGGAVYLLVKSSQVEAIHEPSADTLEQIKQESKPREFKFEYQTAGDKRKEQVIINVKRNYTELFAPDITVFNHFTKRVSLHRVEISPGIKVCLVKILKNEVKPDELEEALSQIGSVNVNSSELYIIDETPVPEVIREDMTVYQFCHNSRLYQLKRVEPFGPDVGLTFEELVDHFNEENSYSFTDRFRRQIESTPSTLDKHNGPPYHCGGPIGTNERFPALQYTCTKKTSYCYKSLVNDRCDECYHGHNLRTRGCWCPINAIETCIRVTYKPVKRYCCGLDSPPCIRSECDTQRVPFVPIPIITVKITTD